MYCILPFEQEFYGKHNYQVHYMGHPLLDEIASFKSENKPLFKNDKPLISILPGSRKQEIERKLNIMLDAVSKYKDFDICVACAPNLDKGFFEKYKKKYKNIQFIFGQTYHLLSESDYAIVTSGTATLETALFKVPQVVCYKSSHISFAIAKRIVDIKYISLVNLIMNREVVKELIQKDATAIKIQNELDQLIGDSDYREKMLSAYNELIEILGRRGCSEKIARDLLEQY